MTQSCTDSTGSGTLVTQIVHSQCKGGITIYKVFRRYAVTHYTIVYRTMGPEAGEPTQKAHHHKHSGSRHGHQERQQHAGHKRKAHESAEAADQKTRWAFCLAAAGRRALLLCCFSAPVRGAARRPLLTGRPPPPTRPFDPQGSSGSSRSAAPSPCGPPASSCSPRSGPTRS
jgi:hypothetical protein